MKAQNWLHFLISLVLWALVTPASAQIDDITPSARLSFGRIMFDQEIEQSIELSSPANHRLTVSNIQLTAPLLARDIQTVIKPGENLRFVLALGKERLFGEYEGSIQINFEEKDVEPILLMVEGYIVAPIELKPARAFYVVTNQGKNKSAYIEIINHRDIPLNIKNAHADSDRFTTRLETIIPGEHYRLELLLDGSAATGEKSEKIILETDQGKSVGMYIQANTIIREKVFTAPKIIDVGALPRHVATDTAAATSLAQILMVYRPDTTDFEIKASVNLDYITVTSERGPDGDRYQLTLTLIPEKVVPGKIEGMVRISTNDEDFSVLEIPLTGYILD